MDERFEQFVRDRLRELGAEYERTRRAYAEGKGEADGSSEGLPELPVDEAGRARLVCRRYAEKRAVAVDDAGRPACFDPEHVDCVGCVEDIQDGVIETWD
ncbi:MAG: DUF7091 family protein [Halohasta sp.]